MLILEHQARSRIYAHAHAHSCFVRLSRDLLSITCQLRFWLFVLASLYISVQLWQPRHHRTPKTILLSPFVAAISRYRRSHSMERLPRLARPTKLPTSPQHSRLQHIIRLVYSFSIASYVLSGADLGGGFRGLQPPQMVRVTV